MMSQVMVEDPTISDNTRLKSTDHLEESIQKRIFKRLDMLVVVIPGTDKSLEGNTQEGVEYEEERISE